MIFLKDGVELQGSAGQNLHPVWAEALPRIEEAFEQYGSPTIITSGFDGRHKTGSLHYSGRGLDFRVWYLDDTQQVDLTDDLGNLLGNDFDVLNETRKVHIHIEYDPDDIK